MRDQIVEHECNIVVAVSDVGLRTRQRGGFELARDTVSGKFGDPPSLATADAGFGASSFVASAANAEAVRKLNARAPKEEQERRARSRGDRFRALHAVMREFLKITSDNGHIDRGGALPIKTIFMRGHYAAALFIRETSHDF